MTPLEEQQRETILWYEDRVDEVLLAALVLSFAFALSLLFNIWQWGRR